MDKKMPIEVISIKKWYTAKDLVGLPGMRRTEIGIRLNMRNAINKRKNTRGKGIEYSLFDLPRETQEFILKTNGSNK